MKFCDICGRLPSVPERLTVDGDDLWICDGCRSNIHTEEIGNEEELAGNDSVGEELEGLRGKNVGQIVLTLNLPYIAPYREIIDDAHKLHDMVMSPWQFYTQWSDGSTVWRAPEGGRVAIVPRVGEVRIECG